MADETQDAAPAVAIEDVAFALSDVGEVTWNGTPVAVLAPGADALSPEVRLLEADPPAAPPGGVTPERLSAWLKAHLAEHLAPLAKIPEAALSDAARRLAQRLAATFGQLPRRAVERELKEMSEDDHQALTRLGVRFGVETLYMPLALKPAPQRLKSILWTIARGLAARPEMPTPGRVSFPPVDGVPVEFYEALGYRMLGGLVVRVDMLERFAADIRHLTKEGPAELPHDLLSVLGIGLKEAKPLIAALSYTVEEAGEENQILRVTRLRKPRTPRREAPRPPRKAPPPRVDAPPTREKKEPAFDPDSPFAVLKALKLNK